LTLYTTKTPEPTATKFSTIYDTDAKYKHVSCIASEVKCIGDDTKAAARQSLNCIKSQKKIKYGEKRFSVWQMEFLHSAMLHYITLHFLTWPK